MAHRYRDFDLTFSEANNILTLLEGELMRLESKAARETDPLVLNAVISLADDCRSAIPKIAACYHELRCNPTPDIDGGHTYDVTDADVRVPVRLTFVELRREYPEWIDMLITALRLAPGHELLAGSLTIRRTDADGVPHKLSNVAETGGAL